MRYFILILFSFITWAEQSEIISREETLNKSAFPKYDDYANYLKVKGLDSFYDPKVDYSQFSGRLTDKDKTGTIIKIQSESKNIKFFKASDQLHFWVAKNRESQPCSANVRSVEEGYLVLFVKNLYPCWGEAYNFRRGTILVFESERLAERIKEASRYRVALLAKKRDFLYQLNRVNKFVWGYKQEQIDLAARYDKEILDLQKKKEESLSMLTSKKKDQVRVQRQLIEKLDQLDDDLNFFRVEKDELYTDRWHLDQGLGLPVYKRPRALKD
jgi:hypothetical protein